MRGLQCIFVKLRSVQKSGRLRLYTEHKSITPRGFGNVNEDDIYIEHAKTLICSYTLQTSPSYAQIEASSLIIRCRHARYSVKRLQIVTITIIIIIIIIIIIRVSITTIQLSELALSSESSKSD